MIKLSTQDSRAASFASVVNIYDYGSRSWIGASRISRDQKKIILLHVLAKTVGLCFCAQK